MESNTPPAIQRNRRAGRISALPPEQPLIIPPEQAPAGMQQISSPSYAAVDPQPVSAPTQRPAVPGVRHEQTVQPAYPPIPQEVPQQQPAPAPRPVNPYVQHPYASGLSAAHSRPYAQQQRPAVRPATRSWQQPYAIPERPTPIADRRALRRDDPDARHAAALERRQKTRPEPVKEKTARPPKVDAVPAKIPSWMWTLTSLMIIGVLALVAFSTLMQAYLKTAADEKQKAWDHILNEYHLTEQADGTLRVTWQDTIEYYAGVYNLDPAFVTAVIRNESSFRTNAVSSVGARGLMQMMPATAEWIAGKFNEPYDFDRIFDADTSIRYGCWYLNYLSELFQGDPVLVCAAYHAGQGEVWGWLGDSRISPDGVSVPIANIPIGNTKTYAERVTLAYGIYDVLLYPENPAEAAALRNADSAAGLFPAAGR